VLLLAQADGTVASRGILAMRPGPPDHPGALAAADINLDGKVDILQANFEGGDVSLFQEDSSGNYRERSPSPFVAASGPTFLAVADVNKDVRPDLLVVNRLGRQISVFLSDAALTLKAMPDVALARAPQAVAVADYNGDTRPDLAVTSEVEDAVLILSGGGNGNFTFARSVDVRTAAQKSAEEKVGAFGVVAGDFNRDGRIDLAVTQYESDQVAILLGNGNGTFKAPTLMAVSKHPTYLVVARLNDDQLPGTTDDFIDLLVLSNGEAQSDPVLCATLPPGSSPGGVTPLLGNGDGTFAAGAFLTAADNDAPVQIAAGRLQAGTTGYDDLVVANFCTNTLSLYPANGAGGFLVPVSLGGPSSTLNRPNAVTLLDRDGDGLIDRIAAANFGGDSLTLFDGGGSNPFVEEPTSPITATMGPAALLSGALDINASDDLEVLSTGNNSLQTFSSMSTGFFFKRRQTPLPEGSGPTAMALADFDRVGLLNLALAVSDLDGADGPSTAAGFTIFAANTLGQFGSASGLCTGGSNAGGSCTSDAFCSGGVCSFSLALGNCASGTKLGEACASDADCPSSTCTLPNPPIPLAAPASALLATDLNLLDADRDGVPNASDNCPSRYNPGQENTRGLSCFLGANDGFPCIDNNGCPGGTCTRQDALGDACDSTTADPDLDKIADAVDNCADIYNPNQADADTNRVGSGCDHDPDVASLEASAAQVEIFMRQMGGGGFEAPTVALLAGAPQGFITGSFTAGNSTQDLAVTLPSAGSFQILSGDGAGAFTPLAPVAIGGTPGAVASLDANPLDVDLDGVLNSSDNCPTRYNPTQIDSDTDGVGDACSQLENPDLDGVVTLRTQRNDNCPDVNNPQQTDSDGDGIGDACDSNDAANDEDDDGVVNAQDNCPTRYNPGQGDFNNDGVGDVCNEATDPDGDFRNTAIITRDNCPDVYNPDQQDSNNNGIGDACDQLSDLAIADAAAGTLRLILQTPQGTWVPQAPFSVGASPAAVTAADLNGDGVTDLAVANSGSASLSVLIGHGDGTFLSDPFLEVPVLPGPNTVQAGFFSRDAVQNLRELATLSPPLNTPVIAVNILSERADIDISGQVGGRDLAIWAHSFGLTRKDPGYDLDADINLDGNIDGLDLVYITSQYGRDVPLP
jgi:hypothetical protein